MKKRSGVKRALHVLSIGELERLPTKALLARLKRLQWCEESMVDSDLLLGEIESVGGKILFKSDTSWKLAYRDVKTVLDTRQHIQNKP